MNILVFSTLCFSFGLLLHSVSSINPEDREPEHAILPPRGWNSYDSFCWIISERDFLKSALIVSQLLRPHGYEYVVVDYLWYRKHVKGAWVDSLGFDVIDKWGRMMPDPARWPSSRGGNGFKRVAKKVHDLGLKFGIHVMRGISTQAVNANTPIYDYDKGGAYMESGRTWRAQDIAIKEKPCIWMPHGFVAVNTSLGAGRAFLKSLYKQYAEWGVDFVKHDCIFGDDFDVDEISFVSGVLREQNRPIMYSLSPGTYVTPALAQQINGLVNMYRVTGDDWDKWEDVLTHFNVARDFSAFNMTGAQGLRGKSWPDLDMLPLGWLTDHGTDKGPYRACDLSLDEQKTQITLWAMAKSPLMFGGDVRKLDNTTFGLITNPTLLEIDYFSSNNKEFPYVNGMSGPTGKNKVVDTSKKPVLAFTSCEDAKVNSWSIQSLAQDHGQICWKESSGSKSPEPLCLHHRRPLEALNEATTKKNQGKLHLLQNEGMDSCLDASPKRKHASRYRPGSFSPCRADANQMWELTESGALVNSYYGLCAVVNLAEANAEPCGVRSWIATGRNGEIYLAFFNLNDVKMMISAKTSDLAKALPGRKLNASCKCQEVWSGKDFGVLRKSISTEVEKHGCALFVLNCN